MIRDIIKEVRSIPMGSVNLLVTIGWNAALREIEERVSAQEAREIKRLMDETASDDGDYGASIKE